MKYQRLKKDIVKYRISNMFNQKHIYDIANQIEKNIFMIFC